VVPPLTTTFTLSDGTVHLYFEASSTTADHLSVEWRQPNSTIYETVSWRQQAGDFCFFSRLAISALPSSLLGSWRVRVLNNNQELFALQFTIEAVGNTGSTVTRVEWITRPPQTFNNGDTFPLRWKISGSSRGVYSHVHVGLDADIRGNPGARTDTSAGMDGQYEAQLNATNLLGTTMSSGQAVYFIIHVATDSSGNGAEPNYWSENARSTVVGGPVFTGGRLYVKPVDETPSYNGTYPGAPGTGSARYSTLYRDNQDPTSSCQGEGCGAHPGVDIVVGEFTEVRAIADGWIDPNVSTRNMQFDGEDNGYNGGWGGLIIIRHDNVPVAGVNESIYSSYAHLHHTSDDLRRRWNNRARPTDGIHVERGQVIGYSGGCKDHVNSGNSDGCHLHFQLDRSTLNSAGREYFDRRPSFPVAVNTADRDFLVSRYTFNPMVFIQRANMPPPLIHTLSPQNISPGSIARVTIAGTDFDPDRVEVIVLTASTRQFVGNAAIVSRNNTRVTIDVNLRDSGAFLLAMRNWDGRISNFADLTVRSSIQPTARAASMTASFVPNPTVLTNVDACQGGRGYLFTFKISEGNGVGLRPTRLSIDGSTDWRPEGFGDRISGNASTEFPLRWCRGAGSSTWTVSAQDENGNDITATATLNLR
jgi:murein DD-endopeptidase MepM/ murein hydrolase activator NlpD